MINQSFHSFKSPHEDVLDETKGLQFHLPKEYLEHMSKTNSTLERIEVLLETLTQTSVKVTEKNSPAAEEKRIGRVIEKPVVENINTMPVPFLDLAINYSPDFYKISRTFLADFEMGKNNFGFQRLEEGQGESFMFIFASFVSYSKDNMPVLLVVEDFEKEEWRKIKGFFSLGSILGCRSHEWGNLSIVSKKDILKIKSNDFKNIVKMIKNEFKAVFWSISSKGVQQDFSIFSYFVMDSLNSVTLVLPKKKAKISNVMKIHSFYAGYRIPIKGVLNA